MQQSDDAAVECSKSTLSNVVVVVKYESSTECQKINLQLLSKHIEDAAQHIVTCSTCLRMAQSTGAITIVREKHWNGLASIIGCNFNGCQQEITFTTSFSLSYTPSTVVTGSFRQRNYSIYPKVADFTDKTRSK